MRELTDREVQTLRDVANPLECLLSDGDTLETLLQAGLVHRLDNCYRPTPLGLAVLQKLSRRGC